MYTIFCKVYIRFREDTKRPHIEVTILFKVIGFRDFSQRPMEVIMFSRVSGLCTMLFGYIIRNLAKDLWKFQSFLRFRVYRDFAKRPMKVIILLKV